MSLSLSLLSSVADYAAQEEAVRHIETTLARSLFNCDEL